MGEREYALLYVQHNDDGTTSTYERPKCKRGDVFFADTSPGLGSEQFGFRPVVVVSNDMNNKYSPTVNVCLISSVKEAKKRIPVHVLVTEGSAGLPEDSVVLVEQTRVIDKVRMTDRMGTFSPDTMQEIDRKLMIQFGLIR